MALFIALTLLISIPIWTHPLPPLSDYINHLARMQVIAELPNNRQLAAFYELNWQVIPNLAMDIIVPPLARIMNVYLAGQVFLVSMFVLIISGILMLNRVLVGRFSVLPLIAIPLLYNFVFLVGLMNYLFGIGVAIWALAGWISVRRTRMANTVRFIDGLDCRALFLPSLRTRDLRDWSIFIRGFAALGAAIAAVAWQARRLFSQRRAFPRRRAAALRQSDDAARCRQLMGATR